MYSAIKVGVDDVHDFKYHISRGTVKTYIDEHPSEAGRLLSIDAYAHQMKRGRALLRLDVNHQTRQTNQCEYVELDPSNLSSCIKQALKSKNVSQLAKVLAECESESRSADVKSPEHGTEITASPVIRSYYSCPVGVLLKQKFTADSSWKESMMTIQFNSIQKMICIALHYE